MTTLWLLLGAWLRLGYPMTKLLSQFLNNGKRCCFIHLCSMLTRYNTSFPLFLYIHYSQILIFLSKFQCSDFHLTFFPLRFKHQFSCWLEKKIDEFPPSKAWNIIVHLSPGVFQPGKHLGVDLQKLGVYKRPWGYEIRENRNTCNWGGEENYNLGRRWGEIMIGRELNISWCLCLFIFLGCCSIQVITMHYPVWKLRQTVSWILHFGFSDTWNNNSRSFLFLVEAS